MKKRYRNVMVVLAIISLLMGISGCGKETQEEAPNVINVETAVVKTMDITRYSSYSSKVKGNLEEEVIPTLSRRVTAVYVTEGQAVRQGQVIVRLDPSKLDIAVQQAEAALASALAAQAANEVQRQTALSNYERTQELYSAGAVSKQALETAKAQYDALNTGAAEAGVAQAQAALNLARQNLADCEITSPMDGIVGRVDVSVGDMTSLQSPVAVINKTADLEVEVKVSESDVSSVQAGTAVKVRIKAIGEEPFTGTVKSVASVADPVTRTYPVKVALPNNQAAQVKSGMFAEVMLGTEHRAGVIAVPMDAVLPKSGESVVYVVNEENRAQAVVVQTGLNDGTYIEITGGLQVGQKVVTKGNTLIDETSVLNFTDGGTAE
ncbi:efflux RND transporter periplasmic adaptor subunit [Pelotomaculum terephthalicicum JT]|uniref:efflux RND transporter periplasmic adaptor subunit n=1 Tax=Pelotomaculum TaxID=191373 RepID=UPI0009D207A4|nr:MULTISPECIES: efflux RND transporter periplasmic adaptor subunit [Pelotomaculum]MCG9968692.1 efflux RND transporter periplasmic adaptor subunit [Pelotomaculum terephthalicicum JT]OPX91706.1 MAG: Multidrug resistance protein MdtA precursor [Pelotomaculum sp. PtaB.Bin117]